MSGRPLLARFPGALHAGPLLLLAAALAVLAEVERAPAATGRYELLVIDSQTKQPVACRIHLRNQAGRPRKEAGFPFWEDHFVIPGKLTLELPLGTYYCEIERGPEYLNYYDGRFTIQAFADDRRTIAMRRVADMAAEGWWSGDLDVRRPATEIELLMRAEDLHIAQVVTWWNDKALGNAVPASGKLPKQAVVQFDGNRFYHLMAGGHTRAGGTMMWFNLPDPLTLAGLDPEYPPPAMFVDQARSHSDAWVDLTATFWWDLPMLVANRLIDSVRLANDRMCRKPITATEAGGKPRDRAKYPDPRGNAQWSQAIYFQLLNCGLHIPPSAGSGSGQSSNPVGYNRIYAHVDGELTYDKWWKSFRAGQVTITNGPLLRPLVDGQLPGHVFQAEAGETLDLQIALNLTAVKPHGQADYIQYLEIIKDGRVEHSVRLDEYAKTGKLPKIHFDCSGWFLIRAVADVPDNYHFGMSGPYYVQVGYRPQISKRSAQFFLDWVYERARLIKLAEPVRRREVLEYHRKARDFWQDVVSRANAE